MAVIADNQRSTPPIRIATREGSVRVSGTTYYKVVNLGDEDSLSEDEACAWVHVKATCVRELIRNPFSVVLLDPFVYSSGIPPEETQLLRNALMSYANK